MLHLLMMLVLAIILFSRDSMNIRNKVCIGELGLEDYDIKHEFCIFRTERTR